MLNLANTYSALGRHEDALVLRERVLEFRRRVLPENHPDIGELHGGCVIDCMFDGDTSSCLPAGLALYNLSISHTQGDDLLRAIESAREALRIWQAALPPSHPDVAAAKQLVYFFESAIQKRS